MTVEGQVLLPVGLEEAFAWVSQPQRLPQWMGGLVALHWGRLAPDAVGRGFVVERRWGAVVHKHPAVLTAWEPPRRLGWELLQDQLTVLRDTTLAEEAGGTRVRVELELQPQTFVARAGLPWFRHEAAGRLQAELQRLLAVVG